MPRRSCLLFDWIAQARFGLFAVRDEFASGFHRPEAVADEPEVAQCERRGLRAEALELLVEGLGLSRALLPVSKTTTEE